MSKRIPLRGLVLSTVLVASVIGCGEAGATNSPGSGAASLTAGLPHVGTGAAPARITIKNFAFSPTPLQVKLGQPITVTNTDSSVHTIKATDKSFDSGNLAKGKSYTFTVTKAGKHPYICDIHQYMTGEIDAS